MYLDMTIHDFDMARFQVGEVEEVYAMGSVLVAPWLAEAGDVETDVVTLRFANGALGVIDNSRQAVYGYDQRLEVFCSAGTAHAENEAVDTVVVGDRSGYHAALPPRVLHAAVSRNLRQRGVKVHRLHPGRPDAPSHRPRLLDACRWCWAMPRSKSYRETRRFG